MKYIILNKLFIVLNVLLILIFIGAVPATLQNSCPHQGNYAYWQCGVTVYYTFDSSVPYSTDPSSQMEQIKAAFNTWNSENLYNNSKVHFQYSPTGVGVRLITIENDLNLGEYVQGAAVPEYAPFGYAIEIHIKI